MLESLMFPGYPGSGAAESQLETTGGGSSIPYLIYTCQYIMKNIDIKHIFN